ncbi:MAG: response regulator [Clostridia bacterium]|nr:response regulator [Clostridia bacterium]
MSLYKIMIVDDEAEVREGIAHKIDWNALGFEVVADAENGRDALEKAESLDLDVVLTDIKMPFMDGLQFGAELARRKPAVKLIIFSGFDTFEYAQEAIKLNVVEYVLKPVNAEELSKILGRVKESLDHEIAQRRNIAQLTEAYQKSLPLLREKFLNELLRGPMAPSDVEKQMERFGVSVRDGRYKVVAVCEVDVKSGDKPALAPELLPVSLRQMVDDQLRGRCHRETFFSMNDLIVVSGWDTDPVERLMSLLSEVCDQCRRVLGVTATIGLGRPCEKAEDLHESYAEAREAAEYKAATGAGKVIYIQDMERLERTPVEVDVHREQQLLSAIKFGSREQIELLVDQLLNETTTGLSAQTRIIGILGLLLPIIQRYGLGESDMLGRQEEWFSMLLENASKEKQREWLLTVCQRMSGCLDQRRISTAKRLVEEAERYVRENYQSTDLSVDRLCDHLHISQSYFSTIFKQETGRSYVQYLTDVRMEHAVELLRTTDDKTYLVAEKVGYDEPNYFSYVFKKRFGVSPSQFRK